MEREGGDMVNPANAYLRLTNSGVIRGEVHTADRTTGHGLLSTLAREMPTFEPMGRVAKPCSLAHLVSFTEIYPGADEAHQIHAFSVTYFNIFSPSFKTKILCCLSFSNS
jgi:hypothetical protein